LGENIVPLTLRVRKFIVVLTLRVRNCITRSVMPTREDLA
jgi:hypothetical protein